MIDILMVEDDNEMIQLLEQYLPKYGIDVFSITTASVALEKIQEQSFDLILLDLTLPDMDGLELCKIIKKEYPHIPIIISTARADVSDKIVGFELGADDYVAKPYDPRELVARINVQIKHRKNITQSNASEFEIDKKALQILHNGSVLDLTMAEFEIFTLLLEHKNMVISREFIVNSADSLQWESSDKSINVMVSRIRSKIGDNGKQPKYIKSIRGVGYQYIGN